MQELVTLLETLEHQETIKHDHVAPNHKLFFVAGKLMMAVAGQQVEYTPTGHFHAQMAEKLQIPKTYYDKMLSKASLLLDDNVNHWLKEEQKNFLIRTFEEQQGNVARAFLSDSYNMIDNYNVLLEVLDALKATGLHVDIKNAQLSETKMYIKVVCPEIQVEATEMLQLYRRAIEVGSGVIAGFEVMNSELGNGAFSIMPRGVFLSCGNGATRPDEALRKIHSGAKMDEFFKDSKSVRDANIRLIKEQMKFAIKKFLTKEYLQNLVNFYTEKGTPEIKAPIADVIEVTAKEYGITEGRKKSILDHFIRGGDTRRIGLFNAITEECQGLSDADLKHDSEVIAHNVLTNFDKLEAQAFKKQPAN